MKITEIQGDVFADLQEGDAFAHGVNCKGVMGAGVAAVVRDRFPYTYETYRKYCELGGLVPGSLLFLQEDGVGIFNVATQNMPGPDATLERIFNGFSDLYFNCKYDLDYTQVKTVRIGAGIGGLDWDDVREVLESVGSDDVELLVYYL